MTRSCINTLWAVGCIAVTPAHAAAPVAVDAAWLAANHVPATKGVVASRRMVDAAGEHVLVLSRLTGPSPSSPNSGRIEHIELKADYYARAGTGWQREWAVRDFVDCPGLDSAAAFDADAIAFTDLNGDGRAEVTIAYRLFCGGGIESQTVKVILRDGATKLAIRGESVVRLPGQAPFGGEHRYDAALLQPERRAFKGHLERIWQSVADRGKQR